MTVMCHVLSLNLPDEIPMQMPTAPATSDGGAVRTNVMVVLNPNDLTTVGKNYARLAGVKRRLESGPFSSYIPG